MKDRDTPADSSPPPRRLPRTLAVLTALTLLGAAAWWWFRPVPTAPPAPAEAPDSLVRVANPGYVGPQVCGECHAARLAELRNTRHFRACWRPEDGPMPAGFTSGEPAYRSHWPGVRIHMHKTDDDYRQTVLRDTPQGEARRAFPIGLVYGSGGKADEVYFAWQGDRLYELPMSWLHPLGRWAEQPHRLPEQDCVRPMTPRCLECHTTRVEHVPGSENQYHRDGMILGVTCEKCHGPGHDHVAHHRRHPGELEGRAVVHPGRLSRERQMDVCGQCHSNAMRGRGPAFSYRPGEPLDAHFRTHQAQGFENDHVADQVKYLRQSRCFQQSETLTCTTCHNPHRDRTSLSGARACLQCHRPDACHERPHLPAAVRDACIDCHMPPYPRVAVKFHLPEDRYLFPVRPSQHRIGIYPQARQEVLLRWYRARPDSLHRAAAERLEQTLAAYWLRQAEQLRQAYRFIPAIGAAREALRLAPSPHTRDRVRQLAEEQFRLDHDLHEAQQHLAERRLPEAIAGFESVLRRKPNLAQAHGKLGTAYALAGQRDRAVEHLRAVVRHDPDEAYGLNMLGWLAYLDGRGEEAVEAFRQADAIYPFTAEITFRWGLAELQRRRWAEAETRFRQVLRIAPEHVGACQGLSQGLRQQGRAEEAVRFARQAVRLTRQQNADALLVLADACADAGRLAEAVEAARQALAASGHHPALAAQARHRLHELEQRSRTGK